MTITYFPELKWRPGEITALNNLNDDIKSSICPIVEITEYITPHLFLEGLSATNLQKVLLDTTFIEKNTSSLQEYIAASFDVNIEVIPVLNEKTTETFPSDLCGTVALKLTLPENEIDEQLNKELIDNTSRIFSEIIVIYNLDQINEQDADSKLELLITNLTGDLAENSSINTIVILSSSFPDIKNLKSGQHMLAPRLEMNLFKKLLRQSEDNLKEKLFYGDYGVNRYTGPSGVDFTQLKYPILPKIKYTSVNEYWIHKGQSNLNGRVGIKAKELAKILCDSSYFYHQHLSYGDNEIYKRAYDPSVGPGRSQDWVTFTVNHHITVIAEELSNLHDI